MSQKRLSKVLADCAVASRRAAEELIIKARVEVNGIVILTPQFLVDITKDKIKVDDRYIQSHNKKYFILNKPKGFVCSHKSEGHKLVFDLLPPMKERLFTVGRLDKDTTGLLLITNDGHFTNEVTHPSSKILKEYVVETKERIEEEHLKIIKQGAWIDGRKVRPISLKKIGPCACKIGVFEGKKHEVRIFILKAKLNLKSLMRIRIGDLFLKNLPLSQFRSLTKDEINLILQKANQKNLL